MGRAGISVLSLFCQHGNEDNGSDTASGTQYAQCACLTSFQKSFEPYIPSLQVSRASINIKRPILRSLQRFAILHRKIQEPFSTNKSIENLLL